MPSMFERFGEDVGDRGARELRAQRFIDAAVDASQSGLDAAADRTEGARRVGVEREGRTVLERVVDLGQGDGLGRTGEAPARAVAAPGPDETGAPEIAERPADDDGVRAHALRDLV